MIVDGGVIREIGFQGKGCAISKSSASLMTEAVKGKTTGEAEALFSRFHDLLTSPLGVRGLSMSASGLLQQMGSLGVDTTYGVFANGNMGASGTKPVVDPHPYRAGTVIRYVALEGPEAGTYFRGRGVFVKGVAVIEVPESFRLVTDEEGLTVQVTPIGTSSRAGSTTRTAR